MTSFCPQDTSLRRANWRGGLTLPAFLIQIASKARYSKLLATIAGAGTTPSRLTSHMNLRPAARTGAYLSRAIGCSQHAKGQLADCQKRIKFIHLRASCDQDSHTGGFGKWTQKNLVTT